MKSKRIWLVAIALFTASFLGRGDTLFAQGSGVDLQQGSRSQTAFDPKKFQESMKEMEGKRREQEQQMLEMMKKVDPEGYERRKASIERRDQISDVIEQYRKKQITEAQAEQKLRMFLKEDVDHQIEILDGQIENAKYYLNKLLQQKQNPELIYKEKIDRYLGRTKPEDRMGMMPPMF